MSKKECIAMVLAGGRGERLGSLTHCHSKPAIHFGGNCRIIDFTLSNCKNSGIDTIGVLSQYFTTDLNEYIRSAYDNKPVDSGIHLLASKTNETRYKGTADAVYKNLAFMEKFSPEYVLVLTSDHIYKMDYNELISFHKEKGADVTAATISVPMKEASRFGIFNVGEDGRVFGFEEKPRCPGSNLASMGVYIFKWDSLKKYLLKDSRLKYSQHDFGANILPKMLQGSLFYTYRFNGYWRDIGTVDKLWQANMDQLDNPSMLRVTDNKWGAYSAHMNDNPDFISSDAMVNQSIVSGGCTIFGNVKHSVLSDSVKVGPGAEIVDSVVMPNVYIGANVKIHNAVVGSNAVIMDDTVIGSDHGSDFFIDHQICAGDVSLIAPWIYIPENMEIKKNSQIHRRRLEQFDSASKVSPYPRHNVINYADINQVYDYSIPWSARNKAVNPRHIPYGNTQQWPRSCFTDNSI